MIRPGSGPNFAACRGAISDHLRAYMATQGLTRYAFSQQSDVGIALILDLEKKSTNPTLATMLRLAQAMGMSIVELLTPLAPAPAADPDPAP